MLVPWVMIVFGLLLFSEWPARRKAILALVCVIAFPFLIVLGEVTRGFAKGNLESIGERTELMSHWQEFFSQNSVFGQTMGRLFSTGGHSIITMTPQEVPYLDFNPMQYGAEMALAVFVPGKFYSDYYYSTTYHLNNYGLRVIIGGTSVELSLPGSLWMLGGWLPVFFGAIVTAMLHLLVMYWLRAATRKSVYKGLFYLAMVTGVIIWGFNLDLIYHARSVVRGMLAAIMLWHLVVRPLLGSSAMTRMSLKRGANGPQCKFECRLPRRGTEQKNSVAKADGFAEHSTPFSPHESIRIDLADRAPSASIPYA